MDTASRRIVIVGATSGIGRAVAEMFQDMGWTVGVAGRRAERLAEVAARRPEGTFAKVIDVNDEAAPDALESLVRDMGGMDVYLHCAGVGRRNAALDPETELRTIATNASGFVRMTAAAWRHFRACGTGHIAVISSIAGTRGLGTAPSYSATKRMQNVYIDALEQLACRQRLKMAFTDIRPGFVDTPLLSGQRYPMLMPVGKVARRVVKAILRRERRVVIDRRYAALTALWRLLPNALWKRFPIPCKAD